MIKYFLIILSLLFYSTIIIAQKKIEVKSDVKSATVYLSGAELNRTANVSLSSGNTNVVFTSLPTNLNQQTINISAEDKVLIQSVQFKLNYLQGTEISAETKKWRDSLELINTELIVLKDRKDILVMQQNMLDENRKTTGLNTGLNYEEMKKYFDFYSNQITTQRKEWTAAGDKEVKLNETKNRITQQLYEFNNKISAPTGEIWVQVSSDKAITTKFYISYLLNNAGWKAEYDVRADKVNEPISLNYKAAIWQTSGEDWKDIELKLSTGNPSAGAAGPVFSTWFMDYFYGNYSDELQDYRSYDKAPSAAPQKLQEVVITSGEGKKYKGNETTSQYTSVTQATLSTEFEIKLPSTIPSGNDVHRVNIGDYKIEALYDYYSIPRLDKDVFLNAHIADWEKLNLLDGPVNVFFKGSYVGQSFINANQAIDTLDISLGRDKNVILTREKLKDFTKEKFIGGKYRQTVTYEIKVKNTEPTEISLDITEQVPVSANAEIKITLDDFGGGNYNAETGKLIWKNKLASGEEKKMKYTISVEFPESKKIYCPSF